MLQPNELMTWDEMVERYPGQWVFVEQTKGNISNIEEGIVRFVTTDDEMVDVWIQCMDKGLDYARMRTTVEPFIGIVDGINFRIDAEEVVDGRDEGNL